VLISVTELAEWCHAQHQPVDGMARAAFAAFVLMRRASVH
jgi:hypothetical protein